MTIATIILTEAGIDALVNAQDGSTAPIQIAEVGLADTPFTNAPTLTALPHEFKRVAGVGGQAVSANIMHMVAQDSSTEVYTVYGIGLYLADGTLFGSYSQPTPLVNKVDIAAFLIALDVAFQSSISAAITFGNANFLNPPATESTIGVARLASDGDADAATNGTRIMTPRLVKRVIDATMAALYAAWAAFQVAVNGQIAAIHTYVDDQVSALHARISMEVAALNVRISSEISAVNTDVGILANRVTNEVAALNTRIGAEVAALAARITTEVAALNTRIGAEIAAIIGRSVTGSGLASGGGDLTASRVINVPAASGAELLAATDAGKAITPASFGAMPRLQGATSYEYRPGGTLIQRGKVRAATASQQSVSLTFPIAFADTNYDLQLCSVIPGAGDYDNFYQEVDGTRSVSGVMLFSQDPSSGGSSNLAGFNWRAEGRG